MSLCQSVKTWKVSHLSSLYRYKIWISLPAIINKIESLVVVPWDGEGHIVFLFSSCWVCVFCKMPVCIVHFSCYAVPMCIQFHYIIVYSDYFSIVALISSGLLFPSTTVQTFFHWQAPHWHFSVLVFKLY